MKIILSLMFALLMVVSAGVSTAVKAEGVNKKNHERVHSPKVDKRKHKQEKRIQQGVKSGKLTNEEAKRLIQEQQAIREKEAAMKSDGAFSKEERKELHRDLDKSSKEIYEGKHNVDKR